ncbi:hypothetical protein F4804DRAFT_334055 [Jackrogersella minutella]|nr:hypothetical protein F4804DRAFT_334055 [Jackrogersella minutella]
MCRIVRQTNHKCGHQLLTDMGKSKFCLFYPHTTSEFHAVCIAYVNGTDENLCQECRIRKEAFKKGLRGPEKYEYVRATYENSYESKSRQRAREAISNANESQQGVFSPAKIAEMNKNARAQVKFYFGQTERMRDTNQKVVLLKTIVQMPEIIDRSGLVELFGSYVGFNLEKDVWEGITYTDSAILTSIARKAGFAYALEDGLNADRPFEV